MFGNNNDAEVKRLEKDLDKVTREYNEAKVFWDRERKIAREDSDRAIENLKKDHSLALERAEVQQATEVTKAVEMKEKEVVTLTIKMNQAQDKVAMYEKAFENMGFDVKDMKEVLNKLVDGLIAKNEIKLISTNNK